VQSIPLLIPHRNEVSKIGTPDSQREVKTPVSADTLVISQVRLLNLLQLRENNIKYAKPKSKEEFENHKQMAV
jgi:hypothetical protein